MSGSGEQRSQFKILAADPLPRVASNVESVTASTSSGSSDSEQNLRKVASEPNLNKGKFFKPKPRMFLQREETPGTLRIEIDGHLELLKQKLNTCSYNPSFFHSATQFLSHIEKFYLKCESINELHALNNLLVQVNKALDKYEKFFSVRESLLQKITYTEQGKIEISKNLAPIDSDKKDQSISWIYSIQGGVEVGEHDQLDLIKVEYDSAVNSISLLCLNLHALLKNKISKSSLEEFDQCKEEFLTAARLRANFFLEKNLRRTAKHTEAEKQQAVESDKKQNELLELIRENFSGIYNAIAKCQSERLKEAARLFLGCFPLNYEAYCTDVEKLTIVQNVTKQMRVVFQEYQTLHSAVEAQKSGTSFVVKDKDGVESVVNVKDQYVKYQSAIDTFSYLCFPLDQLFTPGIEGDQMISNAEIFAGIALFVAGALMTGLSLGALALPGVLLMSGGGGLALYGLFGRIEAGGDIKETRQLVEKAKDEVPEEAKLTRSL